MKKLLVYTLRVVWLLLIKMSSAMQYVFVAFIIGGDNKRYQNQDFKLISWHILICFIIRLLRRSDDWYWERNVCIKICKYLVSNPNHSMSNFHSLEIGENFNKIK